VHYSWLYCINRPSKTKTGMNQDLEQEMLAETRHIVRVVNYRMAVPLFFVFWFLDILYVPQLKWEFLGLRCLILPTALLTGWWLKRAKTYHQAEQAGLFLVFMCGGIISTMIYMIGEQSLYDLPLQLVAIGGLGFIPWSRKYFVAALTSVYAPYLAIELARSGSMQDVDRLLVNAFFIVGVISITWIIHVYREQLRQRERSIRTNLQQEIEQRKKTEQQLIEARDQALAAKLAKESFLANMSHEIRTPLTAIIGFAEQAQDKGLTNTERMIALNTIVASGNHLLSIISDILDFSKIESSSIELENRAFDPKLVVDEVEALITPLAQKKGLLIKQIYKFPFPSKIISDAFRIKQILINLCGNAIKFTEHGSISITLEFDSRRNQMLYRVKDSGIGMSPEQQERIFEAFKQADSSITRRYGGTGLGLSLSSRLAELLGGSLSVNSQTGLGSEFILTISAGPIGDVPFINSPEQMTNRQLDQAGAGLTVGKLSGRVLLAEDNDNLQRLLSLNLGKLGLQVELAGNGEVAVSMALEKHYDLVLMDMQMPVLSGLDAVRQLRERGYTQPIVALTANASQEDRRQCLEAGCNEFLSKPITGERLYACLEQLLEQRTEQDRIQPLHSNLSNEGPEFADIIIQFIEKLPDLINNIETHYRSDDGAKLREVVHNLKGMGGGFGFPELTEYAAEIEKLMQQDDMPAIGMLIERLHALCQRIEAGLPFLASKSERDVG